METLLPLDERAFYLINQTLRNSFFDWVMPWLRNPEFWIPLYVVLAVYFILKLKWKSIIVFISAGITFALTDQIASSLIKPMVQRLRPCNDPLVAPHVHLLVDCGSGFSFVSSHATNHFGLALFLILILKKRLRWITPAAILWASLVCFAQVYVGLHYPGDVIAGAAIGTIIGIITGRFCNTVLKKWGAEIT